MKTRNEIIIARAQRHGSSATTIRGAAKFCVKNRLLTDPSPPALTPERWRAHRALDRAEIGAETHPETVAGYRWSAIQDDGIEQGCKDRCAAENPRKKNLYAGSPKIGGPAYSPRWETIHYKGSHKGYSGSEVFADYQSAVGCSPSGRSAVIVQECKLLRRLRAPSGLVFDRDDHGIFLRRLTDGMDYHPNLSEWRSKNFAAVVRGRMTENFRLRQQAKRARAEADRHAAVRAREIGSVRVTLQDSRRAGNCVEGTLNWCASRLGISREEVLAGGHLFSVPARRIPTDDKRAQAAVAAAWQRETTVQI